MESSERPTVLITGAGIGIGAATARAFADAGYRVVVTDVLDEKGEKVAAGIAAGGRRGRVPPPRRHEHRGGRARGLDGRGALRAARLRGGQRRHRPQGAPHRAHRREVGPHARDRPQGRHAGLPGRGPGHEGGGQGEHDRRLLHHGRRLRVGRARPVLGRQGRRRRPRARPGRGARRADGITRQRHSPRLHPDRPGALRGALPRARRGSRRPPSSYRWAGSASPRTSPT